MLTDFKNLGFGVGLRNVHYDEFLNNQFGSVVTWAEALTENYLPWEDGKYRKPFSILEKIRHHLPIVLHGVSLSLGSADPINKSYLKRLKTLANDISPAWISDHLCWTGLGGQNMHDLLPLPYTQETIDSVASKIMAVQESLGRRILIENVSSYVEFADSELREWEFISKIVEKADCGILLDINNIYVSSRNHGFDPMDYLRGIPSQRVGQIHLAGHRDKGTHCIDTHDEPICTDVFSLYRWYAANHPMVSTMVEWDADIPQWSELEKEIVAVKHQFELAISSTQKRKRGTGDTTRASVQV